uniref:Uncharacterized protein n=1 Tax=Timema tahoe TaxID=61484 RepID=A0A7R9IJH1_9NEOP|nr:unnamed protein product [Timema tahoe]
MDGFFVAKLKKFSNIIPKKADEPLEEEEEEGETQPSADPDLPPGETILQMLAAKITKIDGNQALTKRETALGRNLSRESESLLDTSSESKVNGFPVLRIRVGSSLKDILEAGEEDLVDERVIEATSSFTSVDEGFCYNEGQDVSPL